MNVDVCISVIHFYPSTYLLIKTIGISLMLAGGGNLKSDTDVGSSKNDYSENKILSHIQSFLANFPSLPVDESMSIQPKLHSKVLKNSGSRGHWKLLKPAVYMLIVTLYHVEDNSHITMHLFKRVIFACSLDSIFHALKADLYE